MLSDELLKIGRGANPKSNLSMSVNAKKMLDLLAENLLSDAPYDIRKIINVVKYVCEQLNKEGFSYYKLELFWVD